jgi:imidazolonepropionase-like amidohydrolase
MKPRILALFLVFGSVVGAAEPEPSSTPSGDAEPIRAFENGRWLVGGEFVPATFFVVDGRLTRTRPARVDDVVDLAGKFVVPPFAEAHNHNVSRPAKEAELSRYRNDGIFYVMIQSNLGPADPSTPRGDRHDVEVAYANGGITPSGGHTVALHERIVERGGLAGLTKADLDGRAFFVVDSEKDLDAKWPKLLAGQPDFVKVFMGFSEEIAKRRDEPRWFGERGLDPKLVADVVARARARGLRVSAHVETAADVHEALVAGVDVVAHLPGWRLGAEAGFDDSSLERWMLRDEDAALAAIRGTAFVTTVLAGGGIANPKHPLHESFRRLHTANLEMLVKHGVTIAIGSDHYEGTSLAEVCFLGKQPLVAGGAAPLGVFDSRTLLRLWCEVTPLVIFPGRKIGKLEEGFEASFLVLDGNPIDDFGNVRRIASRVKCGRSLR